MKGIAMSCICMGVANDPRPFLLLGRQQLSHSREASHQAVAGRH